jgi:hypothetical protein
MRSAGSSQQVSNTASGLPLTGSPDSLGICIPRCSAVDIRDVGDNTSELVLANGGPSLLTICTPTQTSQTVGVAEPTMCADASKLRIRIPPPSANCGTESVTEDEPDEEIATGRRTFCPIEHRTAIVDMMERHFCAHPLIPGYSAPTPEGIKAWAVKQIYEFCIHHDLPNLWAYLWENWYRCKRWELWAQSGNPEEIPRLKTTMFVEGQ